LFFQPKFILFLTVWKIDKSIMFTTGIFTTHLPYLAFVCMYMILLIGGHGKIPVKIPVAEQEVIKIKPFSQSYNFIEQINNEQRPGDYRTPLKVNSFVFINAQKEKRAVLSLNPPMQGMADYFLFSRPPPKCSVTIR
jgi:hypothetical protein